MIAEAIVTDLFIEAEPGESELMAAAVEPGGPWPDSK